MSPNGRGNPYQVGCHGDHVIPGLRRIADAIHRHGGKLAMELNHGGRQSTATTHQRQPIAPSSVPCTLLDPGSMPRAMTHADIAAVIEDFVKATLRCLEAGVDLIHLHGAHGYLMGQFLSPQSNRRDDEYGGSLANRARFPLEILAAVRKEVGPDYPIGYRISAVEFVDGGLEIDELVAFCTMLADAGIDLIDVAGGTYEFMARIFQGPELPKGGFVGHAAAICRAVGDRVPVSVAQRLNDPRFASAAMEEHGFSYISLTRGFHADPHYVRKLIEGRVTEILPCIGCNTCLDLCVARVPAGCAANPHSTFEVARAVKPARRALRVLVAGGGVAGMQTARILRRQGHDVTLWEAAGELGGQLRYTRLVATDQGSLADWLVHQLEKLGVKWSWARLPTLPPSRPSTPTRWWWRPAPIPATSGPTRRTSTFPCSTSLPPSTARLANGRVRSRCWAATSASCQVAEYLAQAGAEVHVIDANAGPAADKAPLHAMVLGDRIRANPSVHLHPETTAERLTGNKVITRCRLEPGEIEVTAVIVGGRAPNLGLSEALQQAGSRAAVYTIGDAVRARDIYSASSEAADVAEKIWLMAS